MHYVKHFNINGVDTKQVACIELQGPPNAATEGAVGVLGMDMLSPTHDVYRCVAVNGSVYTWELLSAGMSIINATITGEGGETKSFPYTSLRIPERYFIKVGDLILDSEGYLYQVKSIGIDSCDTTYCGTHIGGIANGDKDYKLIVSEGKLYLITEGGAIISTIDYMLPDNETIFRDNKTGIAKVIGITTINGELLQIFVGDKDSYNALTPEQQNNLFAIITDDTSKEEFDETIRVVQDLFNAHTALSDGLATGSVVVAKATTAIKAESLLKESTFLGSVGTNGKTISYLAEDSVYIVNAQLYDSTDWETFTIFLNSAGGTYCSSVSRQGSVCKIKSNSDYSANLSFNDVNGGGALSAQFVRILKI